MTSENLAVFCDSVMDFVLKLVVPVMTCPCMFFSTLHSGSDRGRPIGVAQEQHYAQRHINGQCAA